MSPREEEDIAISYLKERRPSIRPQTTSDTVHGDIPLHTIRPKSIHSDSDDTTIHSGDADSVTNVATGTQEFSLPPVDGGFDAYLVLVAGFLVEGFTYGLPFSYSVMQQYYQRSPEFMDASITMLALVGTLTTSVTYIGGAIVGVLGGRFSLKSMMVAGSLMMVVGLVAASFANQVWQLILSQGILLGLGGSFVYNSFMTFVPMYWFKYRGIATGIIFAGAGVFGLICPIVVEKGLNALGFRWTLRIMALFVLVLCLGSCLVVRPRYAPDATRVKKLNISRKDFKFVTTSKFITLGLAVLFQAIGYFVPNLFIQPYALYTGVSNETSTTLLSVLNATTIVGQLFLGFVCDRFGYWIAIVASSAIASLSTFFLWGFAGNSLPILITYVVVYALSSSGFSTCFTTMVYDISGADPRSFILVNGAFMLLRGIGNVVGNPLGSLFLTSASSLSSGWHDITYFVGSTLLASAICGAIRGAMVIRAR
ncbi:major facilitator superfamily domain-containing protein [Halteromyces radiatus]|uniref:major facilitator superfamily domain-containing protein n=1 Tax=Halteromyces radiatus TaxID=101107 RepID=UPI00221FE517|nr:major facilitator superfamily domain-containing protein [Halteromyces radiatus]KAI8097611.1 major facilitator superfamily domain-containing protein [Halteromyces radiatus]